MMLLLWSSLLLPIPKQFLPHSITSKFRTALDTHPYMNIHSLSK